MRKVKLITGLKVKELEVPYGREVEYHLLSELPFGPPGMEGVTADDYAKSRIVPIHDIAKAMRTGRRNADGSAELDVVHTYVAYTEEIGALLDIPLNAIHEQLQAQSRQIKDDGNRLEVRRIEIQNRDRRIQILRRRLENAGVANFWERLRFLFNRNVSQLTWSAE